MTMLQLVSAARRARQSSALWAAASQSTQPVERHLRNIKQLTFGGENAEAYFSFDGKKLTFQSTGEYALRSDFHDEHRRDGREAAELAARPDDLQPFHAGQQVDRLRLDAPRRRRVPAGAGPRAWATSGRSTTRYDIFTHQRRRHRTSTRLTTTTGYDAEATIAKDGRIVFTSMRDGDMDIYSMNGDGSDVRRLTNLPGPDGGPFFSADGSKIVFRGRHHAAGEGARRLLGAPEEEPLAPDVA